MSTFNSFKQLSIVSGKEMLRNPLVTVFSFIFPLAFLVMFYLLPDVQIQGGKTVSGLEFGLPSILLFTGLSTALSGTGAVIVQLRAEGVLKALGVTPVNKTVHLISYLPFRIFVLAVMLVVLLGVGSVSGIVNISSPGILLYGLLSCVMTSLSLGLLIASRSSNVGLIGGIGGMLSPLLMFLSGGFLPFSMMPEWVRTVSEFLPFVYVVDLLRNSIVGIDLEYSFSLSSLVTFGWSAVWLIAAGVLFKWSSER